MSVEQTNDFVVLRRILKAVAPDFVLYTRSELPASQCFLDAEKKSIVISDHTEPAIAIAAALFQIGHVKYLAIRSADKVPTDNAQLADYLCAADRKAARWAHTAYMLYWPSSDPSEAKSLTASYVSSAAEWLNHLST